MRMLIVGAGATGGYFGGRLLQAGCDVTFLVRPRRAAELAKDGLVIRSPYGDAILADPPTVQRGAIDAPFDVVLLSCKAYDLADAIASFAPAVGPETSVVPLLNGMKHLDVLDEAFGRSRIMGGLCTIAVTLNDRREIVQLHPMLSLVFGGRDQTASERVPAIAAVFQTGQFNGTASDDVMHDMWEKWVFLSTVAASTCLMRASIGDILSAPGGKDFLLGVFDECRSIASAADYPVRDAFLEWGRSMLTSEESQLTASMLRDLEAGQLVEADHVIGDLIARGRAAGLATPRLDLAYTHLKSYERRRASSSIDPVDQAI